MPRARGGEVRSFVPAYRMEAPRELGAALAMLAREPGEWRPFAGGTDLMVLLEAGKLEQRKFVSLWNLNELRGIEVTGDHVTIGALTTYSEIRAHRVLAEEFPLLARAAAETGGIATQNRGTIGGNIANASPAADSPPVLLVMDAQLEIVSARGSRRVAYRDFHTGYKTMDLRPDELICGVRLPRGWAAWRGFYRKVGTRRAQAISKACMAAAARMERGRIEDVRIALGSVAPTVMRASATENVLRGERLTAALAAAAREALGREIAPIDDVRSTAKYRRWVAGNLLGEFLELSGAS